MPTFLHFGLVAVQLVTYFLLDQSLKLFFLGAFFEIGFDSIADFPVFSILLASFVRILFLLLIVQRPYTLVSVGLSGVLIQSCKLYWKHFEENTHVTIVSRC